MQPEDGTADPEPNAQLARLGPREMRRRLEWALSRVPFHVGISNHMGSRLTAEAAPVRRIMAEFARRGLLFLDSRTSARSVAARLAGATGVPHAARQVFLDHEDDAREIARQLRRLEAAAQKNGHAVGIGHPRDATAKVLRRWLKTDDGAASPWSRSARSPGAARWRATPSCADHLDRISHRRHGLRAVLDASPGITHSSDDQGACDDEV